MCISYLYKRYKAKKYRQSKAMINEINKKLDLVYWDFETGEGKDFCLAIEKIINHLALNCNYDKLDFKHKDVIIKAICKVIDDHELIIESRQCCQIDRKFKILDSKDLDSIIDQIVADILVELKKDTKIYYDLVANSNNDIRANPLRQSLGETNDFKDLQLTPEMIHQKSKFRLHDELKGVSRHDLNKIKKEISQSQIKEYKIEELLSKLVDNVAKKIHDILCDSENNSDFDLSLCSEEQEHIISSAIFKILINRHLIKSQEIESKKKIMIDQIILDEQTNNVVISAIIQELQKDKIWYDQFIKQCTIQYGIKVI
jgi:hypothetical protein